MPWVNVRGFGGGCRLPQIMVVKGFGDRRSMLGRISSIFFGRRDKMRERRNAKVYHGLRADRSHRWRTEECKLPEE